MTTPIETEEQKHRRRIKEEEKIANFYVKQKIKSLRKNLKLIVRATTSAIRAIDDEMKKHSTEHRGKTIASITNYLELQKDIARRFGLHERL